MHELLMLGSGEGSCSKSQRVPFHLMGFIRYLTSFFIIGVGVGETVQRPL